jgi:hypothetical protein
MINSSITSNLCAHGSRKIQVGGRTESRQISIPYQSATHQIFLPTHRLLPADNVNPGFFSSTSPQRITIRRGDIDSVKHLHAKFTINVVGTPVVLAQLPLWFSQIDLRTSSDNALIATMFGDTMMANLLTMVSIGRQKGLFKTLNIDSTTPGYLGNTNALAPGTYIFYLPLFVNSVIGNFSGLMLTDSTADLLFDFTPANPIVSGTGSVVLQNFQFCIESAKLENSDLQIYRNRYKQYSTECVFLDPIITAFTGKTLNAGAITYLNLLPLTGLCSHQMVIVQPVGSINNNAGNASFNYLNVGDNEGAALDLVDVNGNSMWGNGAPVGTKFIRTHLAADNSDNAFLTTKPVYNLTYCDNICRALQGEVKGAYRFIATNVQLALTLPAAPAQEVQTISFTQACNSAGSFRFSFRGELSTELVITSTPAQMVASLQGLKSFASQFVTVTAVSSSFNVSPTVSFTFATPATSGLEGDLVTLVTDGCGGPAATTRTVAGTAGIATGVYDVLVYSYLYKSGSFVEGKLRSDLM